MGSAPCQTQPWPGVQCQRLNTGPRFGDRCGGGTGSRFLRRAGTDSADVAVQLLDQMDREDINEPTTGFQRTSKPRNPLAMIRAFLKTTVPKTDPLTEHGKSLMPTVPSWDDVSISTFDSKGQRMGLGSHGTEVHCGPLLPNHPWASPRDRTVSHRPRLIGVQPFQPTQENLRI